MQFVSSKVIKIAKEDKEAFQEKKTKKFSALIFSYFSALIFNIFLGTDFLIFLGTDYLIFLCKVVDPCHVQLFWKPLANFENKFLHMQIIIHTNLY